MENVHVTSEFAQEWSEGNQKKLPKNFGFSSFVLKRLSILLWKIQQIQKSIKNKIKITHNPIS